VKPVRGRALIPGTADGDILLSAEPISLWGGLDPATGRIIDWRHDRHGESVAGRIFAFPSEKGSSTGSAVLLELIRSGHAPAAIVTRHAAPIVALGAIVAAELYERTVPVLVLEPADFAGLRDGDSIHIDEDGIVREFLP